MTPPQRWCKFLGGSKNRHLVIVRDGDQTWTTPTEQYRRVDDHTFIYVTGDDIMPTPDTIATHLATLNLFREHDGSLWITISGHTPHAMEEFQGTYGQHGDTLHDYLETLIVHAAQDMATRRAAGCAVDPQREA